MLEWQSASQVITAKCCKMESRKLGSGLLVMRPRVSVSDKPFVYSVFPLVINGTPCCYVLTVELSLADANSLTAITSCINVMDNLATKARANPRFMEFACSEYESFFCREAVGRFSGFIPPRGCRLLVSNKFIKVVTEGDPVIGPKCLRDCVSCPGDISSVSQMKEKSDSEVSAKFYPGARVQMTGFTCGTWLNGTEGVVVSVSAPGRRKKPRIHVSCSDPNAPNTVFPKNLILLEEGETE